MSRKRKRSSQRSEGAPEDSAGSSGLPTLLDISPTKLLDLDEKCAYEHFFGKTLEEAREMFAETSGTCSHIYLEDLGWMGKRAFDYYVQAYIDWLQRCVPADENEAEILAGDIEEAMSVVKIRVIVHDKDAEHGGLEKLIAAIEKMRPLAPGVNSSHAREYEASVWWLRGGEGEKC